MLEQSIDFFISFVQDHRMWGYAILFVAMLLEGEVFLIIAGMLASINAFDFGDVLWVSLIGVILGNIIWYYLGTKLKHTGVSGRMVRWAEQAVIFFLPDFREKPFKSIFFSKFIYGANRATVIISGVLRVPFHLFVKAEFFASVLWVVLFATVGFLFGQAALSVTSTISRAVLLVVLFVVIFIFTQRYLTKRYKKHEHSKKEENSNS